MVKQKEDDRRAKCIEYRSQKNFNKTVFLESAADSNLRSRLTLEDPEHGWILFILNQPLTSMLLLKNARFDQTSRPTLSRTCVKPSGYENAGDCPMFRRSYVQKALCSENI